VSRFGITCRFNFYESADMEAIVRRSAGILKTGIDGDAAALLAASSRGTPRVANRLLRRMRDFAQVSASGGVTRAVVEAGLARLEIDGLGLEKHDREILRMIIERYSGGPVGAETLAISVGEAVDTLEDYYEPYLIQAGLLQRTPRGRMVTEAAYRHLGLKPAPSKGGDPLLF
jgi:Holliday junction DNA helicase RuvB